MNTIPPEQGESSLIVENAGFSFFRNGFSSTDRSWEIPAFPGYSRRRAIGYRKNCRIRITRCTRTMLGVRYHPHPLFMWI